MSADGDIEIAVRAEGADDAAAALAGDDEGDGERRGGVREALSRLSGGAAGSVGIGALTGVIAGLTTTMTAAVAALGAIVGFIAVLPGMLKFLGAILKVLQAFLVPISVLFMRLLTPVLRGLVQLLPAWFAFTQSVGQAVTDMVTWLQQLPGAIWAFVSSLPRQIAQSLIAQAALLTATAAAIGSAVWSAVSGGAAWLANGAAAIGDAIWTKLRSVARDIRDTLANLPRALSRTIKGVIPGVSPSGGDGGDDGGDGIVGAAASGQFPGAEIAVNLEGGLEAFAKKVEQGGIDFLG